MNPKTIHHRDTEAQRDPLTDSVIGAAIDVHRALGAGLLESAYEECLCHELECRKLSFSRQVALPIRYKAISLDCAYRMDILVENQLVLELKAVDKILPVHEAQLLTYLRLSGINTGLLLNFNVPVLKDGLKRMKL